jgi:parvulin-like peptidyl-prolyl isomerase
MRITRLVIPAILAVAALAGCQRQEAKSKQAGAQPIVAGVDIDSKDILGRTKTFDEVEVKHILFGWKDLASVYGPRMDPRAKERDQATAAKLAQETANKLRAKPGDIDALMKELSEDKGSAASGRAYPVSAKASLVPEFKNLAMRLEVGEVGIVKSQFGYHVMIRTTPPPPPPPDPLESNDILARPAPTNPEMAHVQHIMIGWKGSPDPRAEARTKADADKVAAEVLGKVRGGGDMPALMKEFSEDPNSKDTGKVYPVPPVGDDPVIKLSQRLNVGEAGMIKSQVAWHIIKRVEAPPPPPPPAPDPLDSKDILARPPEAATKVKHILLGWKEVNSGDPRGVARSREDLEKLVKATVARLKKGEKIEPIMKELSEDGGSAASGTDYPVTPDASLVPPFKNLGLRLKKGEVGVVKTQFGIHIIQRTE